MLGWIHTLHGARGKRVTNDGANEKSMELSNRSEGDNTRTVFTPSHGADTHSHVAGQSLHCLYLVINELSKPMIGTTLVHKQTAKMISLFCWVSVLWVCICMRVELCVCVCEHWLMCKNKSRKNSQTHWRFAALAAWHGCCMRSTLSKSCLSERRSDHVDLMDSWRLVCK